MSGRPLPVWVQRDGSEFRIYLVEKWYKFYQWLAKAKGPAGAVSLASAPTHILDRIIEIWSEVRSIIIEFGIWGWTFTIGIAALLQWLLSKAVSVGAFSIYRERAAYGGGRYGEIQYGGSDRYHRSIISIPDEQ